MYGLLYGPSQAIPHVNRKPEEVGAFLGSVAEPVPCGAPALTKVASPASCHEIAERMVALFCLRFHVVDREFVRIENQTAVHAAVVVASKDSVPSPAFCGCHAAHL